MHNRIFDVRGREKSCAMVEAERFASGFVRVRAKTTRKKVRQRVSQARPGALRRDPVGYLHPKYACNITPSHYADFRTERAQINVSGTAKPM